jgi:hypothetical protein
MSGDRDISAPIGARFEDGEGGVLFSFTMDRGSVIGPRPATTADREQHPEAWGAYVKAGGAPPAPRRGRTRRVKDEPSDDLPSGR